MQKKTFALLLVVSLLLSACTALAVQREVGVVARSELAPGASDKEGVLAVADDGTQLFAHGTLSRKGGGEASYGRARVPVWVQVSWREGQFVQDFKTAGWRGGTIVGDYRVDVAARIPAEVLQHARAKGRALRLIFRIHDSGVLLAWEVEELKRHPNGGLGFVYSMRGGDF